MEETIRVFQAGAGTFIRSRIDSDRGKYHAHIFNEGEGVFLPDTFSDLAAAQFFCRERLTADPSLEFHLVVCDEIIESVRDKEWHCAKERRDGLIFAVSSSIVIALIACGVSMFVLQFESIGGHALFVAGMTVLYALLWGMHGGAANIEAAVLMVIIFVLIAMLSPVITRVFG